MYDFPKIDLHLHLDGSVRPATCLELARQQGVTELADLTLAEMADRMRMQPDAAEDDFSAFDTPLMVMQTAEALTRITAELVEDLAAQGLVYAEIRFAPQFHCQQGMSQREAIEAVLQGAQQGMERHSSIKVGIILCAMAFGPATETYTQNVETAHLTGEYLGRGVVAMDLAGYEDRLPEFGPIFELAHQLELPTTCHAERHVDQCVPFATDRIGHGYQVADEPALTDYVIKNNVPLEMCPLSSMVYGLPQDGRHPLKRLYDAGAPVTVNTDNMTVLDTCLKREYDICRAMGFTERDLIQLNINSARAAFLPADEKETLVAKLQAYL